MATTQAQTIDDRGLQDAEDRPCQPGRNMVSALLTAPIGATLARLAAPNIVAFFVLSSVSIAEVYFVGQLGTAALAGLALAFPMFMLMNMLSAGSMGGAVAAAVARAGGAGAGDTVERLVWHALAIALLAATVFTALFLIGGPAIYQALGGRDETLAAALAYSDVLFAGCGILWLFNTVGSLLRGVGDMRTSAMAMVLSAIIQIPLAGVLCLGLGPVPAFGIAGIAWAVLIGFAVSTAVMLGRIASGRAPLRLTLSAMRFSRVLFWDILRVGLLASLSPVLSVATVILLTGLVSRFGDAVLAGYGIGARLEFLLIPVVFGIGAAMIAMVGTNIGAGNVTRAHRIGWTGAAAATAITGAIGLATAVWPQIWAGLFAADPAVYVAAAAYLSIVGVVYAFHGLGLSLYFASQGAGTVLWPVVAGALRLAISVGGGAVAITTFGVGYEGLLICVAIGMAVFGAGTAASVALGAWRRAAAKITRR